MSDFKNQSPWGSPPGGGNGGFRKGPTPPDIDEIVKKIEDGWLDFDVAIATPDQMSKIGKLGKYLGRKGLMPNPKTGTVVQPQNIAKSIEASRKGRTEIKLDSASVIHFNVGKSSFSDDQLFENLKSVVKTIYDSKPEGLKGKLVKKASISTTMGPGIQLDIEDLESSIYN